MVVAGVQKELTANPSFPHFYENVPDYWMFADGTTSAPTDVLGFIAKSENWILTAPSTSLPSLTVAQEIDHKYFDDVDNEYLSFLKGAGYLPQTDP
jgi:hypothetical protein